MKIAVIGNEDECLGFSLAGALPRAVTDEDEFVATAEELIRNKEVGVVIVADRYFETYSKHFEKRTKKSALPAVVFVPSINKKYLQRDLKGFLANVLGIKL